MKQTLLFLLLIFLTNASFAKEAQVRTSLRALQFNNAAEQYFDRQTAVTVVGKPGKQRLNIRFAPYGGSISFSGGPLFQFQADAVDDYLAYISKYRSWSDQATENGDAFTKEIGKAKSVPGISLKFTFHSGNATNHFLEVSVCSLGNCSVSEPMYLDAQGAEELSSLLSKLKSGEVPGEDVGAKYN